MDIKQDNTRVAQLEGSYKGHYYTADKFGYEILYKSKSVAKEVGVAGVPYTHEQRAKLKIDILCDAYSVSF